MKCNYLSKTNGYVRQGQSLSSPILGFNHNSLAQDKCINTYCMTLKLKNNNEFK